MAAGTPLATLGSLARAAPAPSTRVVHSESKPVPNSSVYNVDLFCSAHKGAMHASHSPDGPGEALGPNPESEPQPRAPHHRSRPPEQTGAQASVVTATEAQRTYAHSQGLCLW